MQDKDPSLWMAVVAWLSAYQSSIYAFLLSVAIAVLRVIYGGGSGRQIFLEGCLCGLATLAIIPLLGWFGLPSDMATFAGGLIGFMGVEKIRELAIKFGAKKAGNDHGA